MPECFGCKKEIEDNEPVFEDEDGNDWHVGCARRMIKHSQGRIRTQPAFKAFDRDRFRTQDPRRLRLPEREQQPL